MEKNEAATKIKALVLSEVFPPGIGGSGRWLCDIYERQPSGAVVVLTNKHQNATAFDEAYTQQIVRRTLGSSQWTLMTASGLWYFLRFIGTSLRLKIRSQTKEVHCGRVIPEGFVGLILKLITRCKLVCYVHGEDIELARASRESRIIVQRVILGADRLVCNSQNTRNLLLQHWECDPSKAVVLNPAIDSQLFKPAANRDELKERYGFDGQHILLTVSRLEKRKGHDTVLHALAELVKSDRSLIYVVIGDGDEEASLKKLSSSLSLNQHVQFVSQATDNIVREYLQIADIFVLANRQVGTSIEGFGIVLLEAQACGLPVIAGKSGGTHEALVHGSTGYCIDCSNASELIRTVSSLLGNSNLQTKMGRAARDFVQSQHDWQVVSVRASESVFVVPPMGDP